MKHAKDDLLHINKTWAVKGDDLCLTLYRKRIAKESGQLQFDAKGYFTSWESLLHRLIDLDINPRKNIEHIVDRILDLKNSIRELLEKLCQETSLPQEKGFIPKGIPK